jgi:hypothetical protein
MTTGGLQHADPGNESTVGGIAAEFFARVEAHYGPPHPPPPPPDPNAKQTYACLAARCVPLDFGESGTTDGMCGGECTPLAQNEWLAVNFLSKLSNGNTTLTVTLPPGQATSWIKKSERLSRYLNASMVHEVTDGQVFQLARPAAVVDATYDLITLTPTPLQRLVLATALDNTGRGSSGDPPPPGLDPGAPPGWLYEAHVAEEVFEQMLAEANVTILRNLTGIASAVKSETTLHSITSVSGVTLTASVFVDGSYEGDLAWAGGAKMVWGRESTAEYGELGAGRQPPSITYHVDPFWADGTVIPHVSDAPLVPVGAADDRIEVYDFRLCMTDSPGHRILVQKPEGYNASEWEFWRRLYVSPSLTPLNAFPSSSRARPSVCEWVRVRIRVRGVWGVGCGACHRSPFPLCTSAVHGDHTHTHTPSPASLVPTTHVSARTHSWWTPVQVQKRDCRANVAEVGRARLPRPHPKQLL